MCLGFFVFNIVFLLAFNFPLSFFMFFFFCFNFYVKEDNMFYIHFQRGSPQQWIRAKGSSKSFLTKAPTPPWHYWEQSTLFSIFLAFFIYLCIIYVDSHTYVAFLPFYIGLLFFWVFFYFFFLCLFSHWNYVSNQNEKQSMNEECVISAFAETASRWHSWSQTRNWLSPFALFSYTWINLFFFHKPWTKKIKCYFKSKKIISALTPAKDSSKLSQRYEINLFLFCSLNATTNLKNRIVCPATSFRNVTGDCFSSKNYLIV